MTIKVEFGFSKNSSGQYIYLDISAFVKSVSVSRGKQNNIGPYSAGQASVDLLNRNRAFDPTFTGSPYFGEVQPAGGLRISRDGIQLFEGVINDWNLSYTLDGDSVASVSASDSFSVFTNQTLAADWSPGEELSSVRLSNILNLVNWPSSSRRISLGQAKLASEVVTEGSGVLDYMQLIELSEAGRLFMDANNNVVFKTRNDNSYGSVYSYTRKNLCRNPSFEVDASYWSAGSRSTSASLYGSASLTVPFSTSINFAQDTSTPYTLSFYVQPVSSNSTVTLYAQESSDGVNYVTTNSVVTLAPLGIWTRVSVTYTSDFAKTYGRLLISTSATVYVDGVLIEASPDLGEYFDGTIKPTNDAITTYSSSWDGV